MAVDLILLLVFVVAILSGYRKGIIMALCTLVILVISCFGASAVQRAFTPQAVEWMKPKVAEYIQAQISTEVENSTQNALEETGELGLTIGGQQITLKDLADLLGKFGLDVQESAKNTAQDITAPLAESVAHAVSRAIVQAVAGTVIFLLAFLVIFLVLRLAVLLINVVDRLPVVHTLNHAGGAVLGGIAAAFCLTMITAVLVQSGLLPKNAAAGPVAQLLRTIAERAV